MRDCAKQSGSGRRGANQTGRERLYALRKFFGRLRLEIFLGGFQQDVKPPQPLDQILNGENTYANSIFVVAADCRYLRRDRSGYYWLFARRLPGVDCARIYRCLAWLVAGWKAGAARTDSAAGGRNAIPDHLVDHRGGVICRRDKSDQPAARLSDWSASVLLAV